MNLFRRILQTGRDGDKIKVRMWRSFGHFTVYFDIRFTAVLPPDGGGGAAAGTPGRRK